MFQHLLREETIKVALEGTSKEDVFRQLINLLPDWQFDARGKAKLLDMLLLRETYGTTAIGDHIALPHVFTDEITEPIALMGISSKGLEFNALDGEAVHVIYLSVFPQTEEMKQVKRQVLSEAQKTLSDEYIQRLLRRSRSSSEALNAVLAGQNSELFQAGAVV